MDKATIAVEGMHCEGCVKSVTRTLSGVAGVAKVEVSLADQRAEVEYDAARTGLAQLKQAVERAGFRAP